MAPVLQIAVLGPPVVRVGERPLDVDTRKAIALLAYLAVSGRPARRDTLAGLLWPETDPDRARATLRRTLSSLRAALGGAWVTAERDAVTLARADTWLDVDEFRALVASTETHGHGPSETCARCLEPLEQAVALHRGDFLAGFGLRDSPEFDDWQQFVGDELRRGLTGALDRLAEVQAARGDYPKAIATARRRLALDPLHEPAHRRLIELYAWSENRSSALEQYRDCVRTLSRELGVSPLPETTALYHAVLEGVPTPAPRPVAADRLDLPQRLPLVGRESEWRAMVEQYTAASTTGTLVVLEGEAGIGKTRLADDLLEHARGSGSVAVATRGYPEETGLAYGVALDLLRGLPSSRVENAEPWVRDEAARLLPELGPTPSTPLDSEAAQARFYEAIASLLEPRADELPSVYLVDDVHWADEASLGLLAYVVHRLDGRRLLLVVSWRPEEVSTRHPVRRLFGGALRRRVGRVLTLGRLSARDVESLAEAIGQTGELARRLHRESGGLPFFVVEYLEALERAGSDQAIAAEWDLPGGVRDLLRSRIELLGELAAQVLAAAAVIGRSFDADLVREASGRGDDETVMAIEELLRAGVVVEDEHGAYGFRHEQARELVVRETSLARRRLLHRRVADALALRQLGAGGDALVARHLAEAGRDAEAADRFVAAGDASRRLYANREALAHYRSAIALGHPDTARLQLEVGDLETLAGDYGAALASYETASAQATGPLAARIDHRIGRLHLRRGEWELADTVLRSAAIVLDPGEPVARARILADRSLAAHRLGHVDDARTLAQEALELAEGAEDVHAQAQALNILGVLASAEGDHPEAVDRLERSRALAETAGDTSARIAALNNLALAHRADGDTKRAIALTVEALAPCVELGDRHREAALRNNLADLLRADGSENDAMEELKRAVAIFAEVGEPGRLEPEIWKLTAW